MEEMRGPHTYIYDIAIEEDELENEYRLLIV